MPASLTEAELDQLKGMLLGRRSALRRQIERELVDLEHPQAAATLREVHDAAEASVIDLLRDLDVDRLHQHAAELEAIQAALARMERGEYGVCIDTGEPIPFERLKAQPTALRTRAAQERYDRGHAGGGRPSL